MERYKRIFVIVLDSLGIGEMPDAARFGDYDVDTFGHICDTVGTLNIPNLKKLGMLNLHPVKEMEEAKNPMAYYARLKESSNGKDTMTGHWEMMGLKIEKPFLTFTDTGFPPELIRELEEKCGKKVIGNKCASGTQILDELGEEEIKNGSMIVYTSADSVMQICGNEETFDLANLYRCCEIARELTMKNEWKVGRIIARPYVGKKKGEFVRTSNRRDYALKPFSRTALNALKDEGFDVSERSMIYSAEKESQKHIILRVLSMEWSRPQMYVKKIFTDYALQIWQTLTLFGDIEETRLGMQKRLKNLMLVQEIFQKF